MTPKKREFMPESGNVDTGKCDSVIILSCMHVISNCVTCLSIYVVYGLRV